MSIEEWPEGATYRINGVFTKWVDDVEYTWDRNKWGSEGVLSESLDSYISNGSEVYITPLDAPYMPKAGEWCDYRTVQKGEYRKAFFIGYNEAGEHVLKGVRGDFIEDNCNFRPINPEREEFISAVAEAVCSASIGQMDVKSNVKRIAGILFDAGFTNKP